VNLFCQHTHNLFFSQDNIVGYAVERGQRTRREEQEQLAVGLDLFRGMRDRRR
jgi:hypothetical protein